MLVFKEIYQVSDYRQRKTEVTVTGPSKEVMEGVTVDKYVCFEWTRCSSDERDTS